MFSTFFESSHVFFNTSTTPFAFHPVIWQSFLCFSYKEFHQNQTQYPLNKVVFSKETLTGIANSSLQASPLTAPIIYRLLGQGGRRVDEIRWQQLRLATGQVTWRKEGEGLHLNNPAHILQLSSYRSTYHGKLRPISDSRNAFSTLAKQSEWCQMTSTLCLTCDTGTPDHSI